MGSRGCRESKCGSREQEFTAASGNDGSWVRREGMEFPMLAMPGTHSSPLREPVATHLRLRGVEGAVAFYRAAFGAVEFMRLSTPEGRPVHAEMRVQGLRLMLDEGYGRPGPTERLVVDDADSFVERALAMGADLLTPLDDQVYSGVR